MFTRLLQNAGQTRDLGEALGRVALDAQAESGAEAVAIVVALLGDLGAGKTVFAQGVGAALAVQGAVLSPTFVLVSELPGCLPLLHADLYRVAPGEVEGLGLEEALESWPGVALIEWADRFPEILPADHLELQLEHAEEGRIATLRAHGPRHAALLDALVHALQGAR